MGSYNLCRQLGILTIARFDCDSSSIEVMPIQFFGDQLIFCLHVEG